MKTKKALVLIIIFSLLTSIFAMSGDDKNEPQAEKKEVKQEFVSVKPVIETENSKSNATVIDRFGIDTGKSEEEFIDFKKNYLEMAKELGIEKGEMIAPGSYFKYRIDINKIDELKELGLFLTKDPISEDEKISFYITHSDIAIVGVIDSVEYFHKTEAEEWKVPTGYAMSRYFVKVDKFLKGTEYYETVPEIVSYLSSIGQFLTISSEYQLKIGQKYILFFQIPDLPSIKFKNDLKKIRKSSLRVEGKKIFREHFDNELTRNYEDAVSTIIKYANLNNINNFYERQYNLEDINEK